MFRVTFRSRAAAAERLRLGGSEVEGVGEISGCVRIWWQAGDFEAVGLSESLQSCGPEGFFALLVSREIDGNEVAVPSSVDAFDGAGFVRGICCEELVQDKVGRPPIHNQMVEAPDPLPLEPSQPYKCHARQRWTPEIETASSVGFEELGELVTLLGDRQAVHVEFVPFRSDITSNDLKRVVEAVPDERRSQRVVSLDDVAPRLLESCNVEFAGDRRDDLVDVDPGRRGRQRVVQHPLLRGCQRVDVVDVLQRGHP